MSPTDTELNERVAPAEYIEAALHAIEAGRADVAHRYLSEGLEALTEGAAS